MDNVIPDPIAKAVPTINASTPLAIPETKSPVIKSLIEFVKAIPGTNNISVEIIVTDISGIIPNKKHMYAEKEQTIPPTKFKKNLFIINFAAKYPKNDIEIAPMTEAIQLPLFPPK